VRFSDLMWAIVFGSVGAALGGASGSRIGLWVGGTIGVGLFILICSLNLRHYLRVLASEIEKSKSQNDSKAYRFDSSWEGDGQIFDEENKPLWQYKSIGGNPFRSQVYGFVRLPPFVIQNLEGRELLAFRRIARFPFSIFEIKEGSRVIGMIRKKSLLSFVSTKYSLEFESGLRCTFYMPRFTVWFLGMTETSGRFLVQLFAHRVWMVGVDRTIDSFHLVAAIAFIHRERLRCS
jgi:hypothetical protein